MDIKPTRRYAIFRFHLTYLYPIYKAIYAGAIILRCYTITSVYMYNVTQQNPDLVYLTDLKPNLFVSQQAM